MKLRVLKYMPILEHLLEIDVGLKGNMRVHQDFNCRFTANGDPILFVAWSYLHASFSEICVAPDL